MKPADPSAQRRREPLQRRSRERVEQILAATRELLREQGIGAITTTRIAECAGLPVGSIYQYFPDKTAIFCGMYSAYLEHIQRVLLEWERDGPYEAGWRVFFGQLFARLKRAEASGNLEIELLIACQTYPELEQLDKRHAELIAQGFARMLRRCGSRWSKARLHRLSLFLYRLNSASLVHRQQNLATARESQQWGMTATLAVVALCMPDS